jgi:DNA polymerase I
MATLKNRILLIDFYNLYIRNFLVVPVTNDDGEHMGGTFGFLRSLKAAIDQFKPTAVYIISDGPNSSLRRKMVDKNYKSSRRKTWKRGAVKAYDFLNEAVQKDSYNSQITKLYEYLDILPVKTLSLPYVEADDLIAEIVNTMPSDTGAIIYSTDADYKQLVNASVVCYNPTAKQLTTKDNFFEKQGFRADNYIYFKVIDGDKSDDLPGVPGIGKATFLKLFPQVVDEHIDSLDEIFDIARHAVGSRSKVFTKSIKNKYRDVLDSEDLIRKNYKLMQLLDVDISLQSKDICKEIQTESPNEFNRFKLRKMFISDKLGTHVRYFDEWSRVFSRLMMKGKQT